MLVASHYKSIRRSLSPSSSEWDTSFARERQCVCCIPHCAVEKAMKTNTPHTQRDKEERRQRKWSRMHARARLDFALRKHDGALLEGGEEGASSSRTRRLRFLGKRLANSCKRGEAARVNGWQREKQNKPSPARRAATFGCMCVCESRKRRDGDREKRPGREAYILSALQLPVANASGAAEILRLQDMRVCVYTRTYARIH